MEQYSRNVPRESSNEIVRTREQILINPRNLRNTAYIFSTPTHFNAFFHREREIHMIRFIYVALSSLPSLPSHSPLR